jgi:hypothetical protein
VLPRVNRLILSVSLSFLFFSWTVGLLSSFAGGMNLANEESKKKKGASGVFFLWFLLSDINDFDLIIINFLCIKIYI